LGERRPVTQNEEGVSFPGGQIGIVDVLHRRAGGQVQHGALTGGRIIGDDGAALFEEHANDVKCGRLAYIVGATLEGESQDSNALTAEGPKSGADLVKEATLLLLVDLLDFREDAEVYAKLLGD